MASRKRPPQNLDESSAGYIGYLVVGDEPCTFVQVRDVLYRCASAGKLWPKLLDIATSLEIPTDSIMSLEKRIKNDTITYPGALLEILEVWRGKFSTEAKLQNLINVLERNGLADCADALWIHFNERYEAYVVSTLEKLKSAAKSSTWENLPEHLKLWMNSKSVLFQGNKNKLEELTAQIATPVDENILLEFAEANNPCIVNKQVSEHLEYYVHRTVRSRNVLKVDVLKENCKDVFIIEGMEKHQLSSLVPDDESIDVSGNQLEKLTVRLILLQHASDFDKISRVASTPVHWVKYKNGSLEFFKSSGSVINLQKHIDDAQASFSEEELARRAERVVVLADSPGMGKTCLLANIAHQIMREQPNLVVRFIVLKEFVDALSSKKINTESIVNKIAEKSSEYEFGRKLVEHALKTQKCVLLFDGLDEVLSNQMTTAMEILKAAANLPSAQVYVATRPHFRDDVENQLHVLAHTIQPFEVSNQINFLVKFWTMKGAIANDELNKFTNECVNQLSSMTDSERKIAGIPLQCRLLAEAYEEHAIRCSKTGYKDYEGADSVVMINSMFKIYERHMELRFEKMQKQESMCARFLSFLTKRNQYETIKQTHMYFALKLLFPEHAKKFKGLNSSSIPLNELCGLGILEATHSNDIRFVHRTFAEFLVAMLAHEYIQINYPHRDILLSSLLKLTLKDSRIHGPFYRYNKLESFYFNFPVICYFLNGFIKNETENEIAIDYNDEAIPYYIASAYHNIPHILTRSVININPIETDEVFKRNLFYVIANHSSLELMKIFCSVIDITQIDFMSIKKSDKSVAFIMTPLHFAIQRGHYGLVDYLLKKQEGNLHQLRYLMQFCAYESSLQSNAIVEDKIQIIKLLVKRNKGWIDEQLPDQTTPLMQTSVHVELLECLIHQGANLNIRDEDGNTVLHAITEKNVFTPESYDWVLNALNQRGFQHFNEPNSEHTTPLHVAVQKVELLSITLELFISKGADFNAVDKYNNTVLHYAVQKQSAGILDSLIKAGADENARGQYNRTVLHLAASSGNLKYFILRGHDVNVTDEDGYTPLHLAVALAETNTHEVVVLLVEHGADMNAIDKFGTTPLDIANGRITQVETRTKEFLVKHGAKSYESITEILKLEETYINWKSEVINNNLEKLTTITKCDSAWVQKLKSAGTSLHVEELMANDSLDARKFSSVLLAKEYDLKMILKHIHDAYNTEAVNLLTKEVISTLYDALMSRQYSFVHFVMQIKEVYEVVLPFLNEMELTDRNQYTDKLNIIQLICVLDPVFFKSKQKKMYSLINLALLSEHEKQFEVIQLLISHNVDLNERDSEGFTPLNYAVAQKNTPPRVIDIVKLLIENGADPDAVDTGGYTFLHWAPYFLTPELYDELILFFDSSGRNNSLKLLTNHNHSLLHNAVLNFNPLPNTLDIFKSNGIDFNGQDNDGDCVVFLAIEGGRDAECLNTLFTFGADWKIPNKNQENALHVAALYGNVSALELFISLGCDVNAKNNESRTPLHNAILAKKDGKDIMTEHEIVVMLLKKNMDVTAKDTYGKTPIDLAKVRLQTGKVKKATLEVLENYSSK